MGVASHTNQGASARPAAGDGGWDALLVCLGGFILASVGRIHQLFPVLAPLKPALVAGGLAVVLLLLDPSPRRGGGLRMPATGYLLALAGWMALSVPLALWPSGAVATWLDFARTVAIYVVIIGAARTVRDVERLALVYFAAAVIFAVVVLTRFDLGDEGRLAGLYYYDANDFATFAVSALPLGLYFAVSPRFRGPARVLVWCGIGALAVAFAWSGSRGGFLALFAVAAWVLLRASTIARRWRVAAVVAIAVLTAATASESYWKQVQTIVRPAGDYNLTSEEGRLQIWERGLGYTSLYPVFGVGPGNFATAEGTISPRAERQHRGRGMKWGPPHNSYLQVAAELGVPGVLLFVGFLVSVFAALRRPNTAGGRHASADDRLAQSLTAALIGFLVGAFFLTLAYYDMLYVLAALAIALRRVRQQATPAPAPPGVNRAPPLLLERVS